MGIFDFLRKIIENKKSEDIKPEKIALSEIGNWIEIKKKDIEAKERKLFALVKDRINVFINELEAKINIVKNFDVHARKVEGKFKSASEEGRSKYLAAVSSLINNLNNLQEDKAETVIFKVDRFFSDFNKNSRMSYERATILIGKEMADLKNELKVFSKDILKVFGENKDIVDFSKAIFLIELKLKQVDEIKKDEDRTNEKILSLDKEINDKKEENKGIFEEIEKIKKSPEYLGHLKILGECKSLKEGLEKDFIALIQLIDFKALGNFYHIFEDKIERVKSYRNEFQINFQKDNGKEILYLLNISKLNTGKISDKIDAINRQIEKLKDNIENDKDKTKELSYNTENIALEIDNLKNIKNREEKRLEKFKIIKEEIANEVKKDLEKMRVDLY
ncbi:MAG: hypothetical protein AABW50_03730 [Nanoarchaeota archaeon]